MAARKRQRRTTDSALVAYWADMRKLDHSQPGTAASSLPGCYRPPAEDNGQARLLPVRSQLRHSTAAGRGWAGTSAA